MNEKVSPELPSTPLWVGVKFQFCLNYPFLCSGIVQLSWACSPPFCGTIEVHRSFELVHRGIILSRIKRFKEEALMPQRQRQRALTRGWWHTWARAAFYIYRAESDRLYRVSTFPTDPSTSLPSSSGGATHRVPLNGDRQAKIKAHFEGGTASLDHH